MKRIIPPKNLVFLTDNRAVKEDCSSVNDVKYIYYGEDDKWVEYEPFTGKVKDYDWDKVDAIFQKVESKPTDLQPWETATYRGNGEWNIEHKDDALSIVKEEKLKEIGRERTRRMELMPYTAPDGEVEVKLREEPPIKPRQTWLSSKAGKAESRIRRGLNMDDVDGDKYLIAADDTKHEMTADDWLDLGEKIDSWITGHIFAATQHIQAVKDLGTVEDVEGYDYTKDHWPS